VTTRQVPARLMQVVEKREGRVLLVCTSGNTSLRVAQVLGEKGIRSQSLADGITNLARSSGRPVLALVKPAA